MNTQFLNDRIRGGNPMPPFPFVYFYGMIYIMLFWSVGLAYLYSLSSAFYVCIRCKMKFTVAIILLVLSTIFVNVSSKIRQYQILYIYVVAIWNWSSALLVFFKRKKL